MKLQSVRRLDDLTYEAVLEDESGATKAFILWVEEGNIRLVKSPDELWLHLGKNGAAVALVCQAVAALYRARTLNP
jgi:hypothetical protein